MTYSEIKQILQDHGQSHLLAHYDLLSADQQQHLLAEVADVDFPWLERVYHDVQQEAVHHSHVIEPIESTDYNAISQEQRDEYHRLGMESIARGEVAAFLFAGGQGTRLGSSAPKGCYDIGLPSGKSLFQLQAERLLNLKSRTGFSIPWYIMTSPDNHEATVNFFKDHDYFNYDVEDVLFFQQEVLPAVDYDGKLLMKSPYELALSPNGNGRCFLSLHKAGLLEDMKRRGIQWLFVYGVDNALVKVADPAFVGFTIQSGHPVSSKAIPKKKPTERVGIICMKNGKPGIVEYSEMPQHLTEQYRENGDLVFNASNVLNHVMHIDFIDRIVHEDIPYHAARKKVSFVNAAGDLIEPDAPNAFKFEQFMFDYFDRLEGMALLMVRREDDFAPVKNREGDDSPAVAREMLMAQYLRWLADAGLPVEEDVEISPLVSYGGEGLDKDVVGMLK